MSFSNILLVIDSDAGDALALERAVAIARNENATLSICSVVNWVAADYPHYMTEATSRALLDRIVAERFWRIERLLRSADVADVSPEIDVLVGSPHVEISRYVRARRHDLVVKSIAQGPGIRARSLTREDRDLMRHCPSPVWLVNVENVTDDGAILAAIDMPESEKGNELNDSIVSVSRSLALAEFRALHVVHAWQLTGEGHMRARGDAATSAEVDRLVERERARRMAWLRDTVNKAKSESERMVTEYLAPDLHVIKGNPRKEIPRLAKGIGAQLIILGSNARNGLPGLLIGNTSERIVWRSDCSILVIKQPSLLSPPARAWRVGAPTPDVRSTSGRRHRRSESHTH